MPRLPQQHRAGAVGMLQNGARVGQVGEYTFEQAFLIRANISNMFAYALRYWREWWPRQILNLVHSLGYSLTSLLTFTSLHTGHNH